MNVVDGWERITRQLLVEAAQDEPPTVEPKHLFLFLGEPWYNTVSFRVNVFLVPECEVRILEGGPALARQCTSAMCTRGPGAVYRLTCDNTLEFIEDRPSVNLQSIPGYDLAR